MEIQKSDKEQEKLNIEKVLEEKGYLMTAPFGTSMLPPILLIPALFLRHILLYTGYHHREILSS